MASQIADEIGMLLWEEIPVYWAIDFENPATYRDAENHSTKSDLFSEEYMEKVYQKQVEIWRKLDYIKGISPWILYDFRASRRFNRFQRGFNRKGLIASDKKTRKLAFYILQ